MAEDPQFSSRLDNKRKFDDQSGAAAAPPTRRPTGFSAPITSPSPDSAPPPSYNNVPPPPDGIQLAKQRAQEIAARLFSDAEAKRPKVDNGGGADDSDHSQKPLGQAIPFHVSMTPQSSFPAYGYQGSNKKIEIPNGRVGVIIGKGGETIKYLQTQSGAKIQVTRDMDADPNSQNRMVELIGTSEQINRAEQLINDVLAEAEAGGSGMLAVRKVGNVPPIGAEQFVMKVPNNKVGLIIGKGGETIKNMQAKTGARIQVIPLHLPPGDTSLERTVQMDGTKEQIELAKQLVTEVTSENRMRNPPMSGGYSQQGYHQPRPPTWGPPGAPQMQQPGYGYMQPGAYAGQPPQYTMPQQAYGGYPSYPDQSSNQPAQQTTPGTGYDYYNQQQPQQPPQQQPPQQSSAPTDSNTYNYGQPPNYSSQGTYGDSAYSQPNAGQQQGYGQDSYSGGYPAQAGYTQPASNPQPGYEQQGYGSTAAYPAQDGSAPTYGAQGGPPQVPPAQQTTPVQASATQQGYNGQQPSSTAASYPSQPGYGGQLPAQSGYMQPTPVTQPSYAQPPQGQKPPTQQPPSSQAGYVQPTLQPGYPHGQPPPAQSGYAQVQPSSGYGAGVPPSGYGQQQQYGSVPPQTQAGYGSGGYSQPPPYSNENAAHGAYDASATQTVPSGVAKTSPQS